MPISSATSQVAKPRSPASKKHNMNLNFNKLKLYKDNYNIYNLITKINNGYRLYFCQEEKLFYIINIANRNEICHKFSTVNAEILKFLQISRVENAQNLFNDIEKSNTKLSQKIQKNNIEKFNNMLAELSYQSSRNNHITSSVINRVIEEYNA